MARSLLRSLVNGTRQVLAVQVFVSVLAVALAGWTLAVTSEALKERDRLRERVVQLEGELAARGVVTPQAQTVVSGAAAASLYPPELGLRAESEASFPAQLLNDLFAPPATLRTLVLHVRSQADAQTAQGLAQQLSANGMDVSVHVLAPRDGRASSYIYYDGRQSRTAAAVMAQVNDGARRARIAQWSAQLRGLALPERGEFTPDRLDIVLPLLPAPAPVQATP